MSVDIDKNFPSPVGTVTAITPSGYSAILPVQAATNLPAAVSRGSAGKSCNGGAAWVLAIVIAAEVGASLSHINAGTLFTSSLHYDAATESFHGVA